VRTGVQVNNAGLLFFKSATECTAQDYARMMATNLESCFHLSQLAHPLLLNASIAGGGSGSVVHVSSIASFVAFPWEALYSTAKGCSSTYLTSFRKEKESESWNSEENFHLLLRPSTQEG
jgi:Tropinone reductase 1